MNRWKSFSICRNKEEQHFSQIIDRLYLTSANNITDANLFKYRITHIINATRTVPLRRKFRCLRVNILDSAMEQISTHFDMVADFINDGLACGGSVVIHCISGISRSSTLVIAFLMKHRNMSLKDAFDLTRSKRWFIRPNIGFFKQLVEYEKELFKSNTVRMVWCEASQSHVPDFILEDKSNYKYFYLCVKK
ncbi:hypothetical protein RDWZM_010565 [Blomia tropicalis]|uniref:Protein-tyrosine-phosphatase n=1 Tax=Blomia tropicalis TaxID=40697 RepID=A0A9Q0M245_BLOTA|nr:hypothetical protein RDWZM_010565 [Blomia tropicalis]